VDWPLRLLGLLKNKGKIRDVLELGCSNGWRLDRLRDLLQANLVGVDASAEAIQDGKRRYPGLLLKGRTLSNVPLKKEFDLVIVNFVLDWMDRRTLAKSISEIDRVVKDDGYLLTGDFLPDCQQRRVYHHYPNNSVFTYKQDYPHLPESLGT
jgi:SAM-dependent methyltransferase